MNVPRRPDALERWLPAHEASAAAAAGRAITPGTEKLVVWHGGAPCRTDLALVYIHGYTGSRQASAPVPEQVAGRLAANLFCTRLTGSGLGADAIGNATLECWQRDVVEALQVGAVVGRRVVLVGMSTGASLAVAEVARNPSVAALVLLAPNFWPRNRGVSLLLTPAGPLLARLLVGRYRDLSGRDEMEDRYWTTRHDSRSLIPMMQAVRNARRAALEAIRCPTLVVYTEAGRGGLGGRDQGRLCPSRQQAQAAARPAGRGAPRTCRYHPGTRHGPGAHRGGHRLPVRTPVLTRGAPTSAGAPESPTDGSRCWRCAARR